jgi:hypothetical protein
MGGWGEGDDGEGAGSSFPPMEKTTAQGKSVVRNIALERSESFSP